MKGKIVVTDFAGSVTSGPSVEGCRRNRSDGQALSRNGSYARQSVVNGRQFLAKEGDVFHRLATVATEQLRSFLG